MAEANLSAVVQPTQEPPHPVHSRAMPTTGQGEFEQLLRAGIARVQALSGSVWTDYNEHDPGVTILEQLCFALTDLGYRVDHPMSDLLATAMMNPVQAIQSRSSASDGLQRKSDYFHPAPALLTTSPITENDLRRLVIDRFNEVTNIWFRAVEPAIGVPRGTYEVEVQLSADPLEANKSAEKKRLLTRIHHLLMSDGILGMTFRRPVFIDEQSVVLAAELVADPDDSSEAAAILSGVLLEADLMVNPQPIIRPYKSLLAKGLSPARVFEGPLFSRGHVDVSHLSNRPTVPDLHNMRAALSQVKGVLSVGSLQLEYPRSSDRSGSLRIRSDPTALERLQVMRGGEDLSTSNNHPRLSGNTFLGEVERRLVHRRRQYRFNGLGPQSISPAVRHLGSDLGQHRPNLQRYDSIQHLFPAIYGLGTYGDSALVQAVTADGRTYRSFAALPHELNQLRAFLLLFEQQLANFLSQLVSAPDLLSWRKRWTRSYFHQSVPSLIEKPNGRFTDEPPGSVDVLMSEPGDTPHARLQRYHASLTRIGDQLDPLDDRAERAYDHLLARVNERFDNARLSIVGSAVADKTAVDLTARNEQKRLFLKDFLVLGGRRAASARATDMDALTHEQPTLAARLELFAGLPQNSVRVVDHVRLGPVLGTLGIDELMIKGTDLELPPYQLPFRVGPSGWALSMPENAGLIHLVGCEDSLVNYWQKLSGVPLFVEAGQQRSDGQFGLVVIAQECTAERMVACSVEAYASLGLAETMAGAVAQVLPVLIAAEGATEDQRGFNGLPTSFHSQRLSAFVDTKHCHSDAGRCLFAEVLRQQAPAHMAIGTYPVNAETLEDIDRGLFDLRTAMCSSNVKHLRRIVECSWLANTLKTDLPGAV